MRVEYFHIDKQNELVEYYNKTIVPLQNELNKEKENFDNRVNNLFCVVMFGLINVNILYYSFSTLYQMCNLRQSL